MADETYSREQVQKILEVALMRQDRAKDGLGHNELVAVASDMGLSESEINTAIAVTEERADVERQMARIQSRRRRRLTSHATTFVIINAMLFLIDLLTGGGWWFYWPLIGWGVGLAFQARNALMADPERDRDKALKQLNRQRAIEARRSRNREWEAATKELGESIEAGALQVMGALSKQLRGTKDDSAESQRDRR